MKVDESAAKMSKDVKDLQNSLFHKSDEKIGKNVKKFSELCKLPNVHKKVKSISQEEQLSIIKKICGILPASSASRSDLG